MNEEGRRMKVERRIPVQSRVDIFALASLDIFFDSVGYQPQSISALVSQAIDLLYDKLLEHELIPEGGKFDSVAEANNYLNIRGLRQRSLKRRGDAKIATAIGFENLRAEGVDPEKENPAMFNQLHNRPRTTDQDQSMKDAHRKNYDSTPRGKSEEELDELAKAMYRKHAAQRELYEKMEFPVNEVEHEPDDIKA
jgi:hypothetical protein